MDFTIFQRKNSSTLRSITIEVVKHNIASELSSCNQLSNQLDDTELYSRTPAGRYFGAQAEGSRLLQTVAKSPRGAQREPALVRRSFL
jgi:hypothetical protein